MSNRKVLVLGGSRGIGAAIVRKFAIEGATVTFSYAGSVAAAEALAADTGAKAIRVDSADRSALIAAIAAEGPIDVLVVNAGALVLGDPFTLNPDAVDRMIDINIRAAYHASVEAARRMPVNGRILIIGSTNGDRMPFAGGAAYAMTKSAIQGMVRGLARDFGDRGITIVNSIQPGPTDTDMNPAEGPMASTMHGFMHQATHQGDRGRRLCGIPREHVRGNDHGIYANDRWWFRGVISPQLHNASDRLEQHEPPCVRPVAKRLARWPCGSSPRLEWTGAQTARDGRAAADAVHSTAGR
jgi:cyclic-di-GMP-binding biofilm dispersal mediator protein